MYVVPLFWHELLLDPVTACLSLSQLGKKLMNKEKSPEIDRALLVWRDAQ